MLVLSGFFASLGLWLFFIVTTKLVDDARTLTELNLFIKIVVIVFVFFDGLFDATYAKVLFWEFTDNRVDFLTTRGKGKRTFTSRLKFILKTGLYDETEWRFKLSLFICKYIVSPWDFDHCGMGFGRR